MMYDQLLQKLEAALAKRNPLLVQHRLEPGLPPAQISKSLTRAGVVGDIEPLVELYAWHNGSELHGEPENGLLDGFAPPKISPLSEGQKAFLAQYGIKRETEKTSLHFMRLKTAIIHFKDHSGTMDQPRKAVLGTRYFPVLWDGSTGEIALDLDPAGGRRVVSIQLSETKDAHLLREAYESLEAFLLDLIRANETSTLLSCVQTPGKPIDEEHG
jgi:hypothetical protein